MKLELFIFGLAGFFIYNSYYDNKYSKLLLSYKKYYRIGFIIIAAISVYLMIKRDPSKSKELLLYTNNMIKYMPIDKSSMDLISPIFDMTTKGPMDQGYMSQFNMGMGSGTGSCRQESTPHSQQMRNVQSSGKATKRSVSETKKKYVAYNQGWKCGECGNQLTHTFEIDHRVRLEQGGSNDITNLVALCRECHGQKTAMENM
jgi:5-methylcytosine-specific restriction protein A